ncbi:MAG: cupin domain-containing protein [Candidatus Zixiibacteriota bacterium]
MPTAAEIIALLKLQPHPHEGGYFYETYRCDEVIDRDCLPGRYDGSRTISTAIYYLLTPDTYSAWHRLRSDEIFHFYLGDPVTMFNLFPDGSSKIITLGQDIMAGQQVQVVVPKGTWQGAILAEGGQFALLGTTVAPGFEYDDYGVPSDAEVEMLVSQFPEKENVIRKLSPCK